MSVMSFAFAHMRGLSAFAVMGDHMEPQLRQGDYLMVEPTNLFTGEGTYILDFNGDGGCPYIAERVPVLGKAEVRIWHPNPAYSRHVISVDEFNRQVVAKVVAEVRMKDRLTEIVRRLAA